MKYSLQTLVRQALPWLGIPVETLGLNWLLEINFPDLRLNQCVGQKQRIGGSGIREQVGG